MASESKSHRVCFYVDAAHCGAGGGMHLRLRSNVLAFHDLGWHVEVVLLGNENPGVPEWAVLPGVDWTVEPFSAPNHSFLDGVIGKVEYRLGYPGSAACRYLFPKHDAVRATVAKRIGNGWLHLFEGLPMANALPFLGGDRVVFSHHDIWHEGTLATRQAYLEIENRPLSTPEVRELRFLRRIESLLYAKSDRIFTISARDCTAVREEGWKNVDYLPMSVEESAPVRRSAPEDGLFRILHLGRIGHLPSYRSLEFLLQEVFPLLAPEVLAKVRMRVVGKVEKESPLVQRILQLREPFAAQVEMVGYVPDILDEFAGNDVQIAAPTAASGLQTRIVESFARGLPVISSEVGARGLEHPVHRVHLWIGKTPGEFAAAIAELAANRHLLKGLTEGGLAYYERWQSRKHVAERLRELLRQMQVL